MSNWGCRRGERLWTESVYDEIMTEYFTEGMRHPSLKRKQNQTNPHTDSVVTQQPKEKIKSEGEMKVTREKPR